MSLPAPIRREIVARTVSVSEAIEEIPDGSRVFIGAGAGEPLALADAVAARAAAKKLHLLFGFSLRRPPDIPAAGIPLCSYLHVGYRQASEMEKGGIEWIPSTAESAAGWIGTGRLAVDAALIQVHPGDAHGQYSLGTAVDFTKKAVEMAQCVIALVNPFVPRTHGQSFVEWRKIHRFVRREEPLPEVVSRSADAAVEEEIARNVIPLIPDGSTLQLGFPRVPRQLLSRLATRRDLGIHSLLVSDWVMELLENGNVTNARKGFAPGKVTASCALGSRRFYEYLHDSPAFDFQPADAVIRFAARNPGFINIVDASGVDVLGRARFENSPVSRRLSAFLGVAPGTLPGMLTVAVLASRDAQGNPAIRAAFSDGDFPGRMDAWPDVVVTEYGAALLSGKTASQRALALIPLAHPDDRAELWDAALARRRIVGPWKPSLHTETWVHADDSDPDILVRMALAVDFHDIVRFHVQLPPEDVRLRFFSGSTDPGAYWETAFFRENVFVFLAVERFGGQESLLGVAECGVENGMGEIALVVHPQHRRRGVGKRLMRALEAWADGKSLVLRASVLPENVSMLRLLGPSWREVEPEDFRVFIRPAQNQQEN